VSGARDWLASHQPRISALRSLAAEIYVVVTGVISKAPKTKIMHLSTTGPPAQTWAHRANRGARNLAESRRLASATQSAQRAVDRTSVGEAPTSGGGSRETSSSAARDSRAALPRGPQAPARWALSRQFSTNRSQRLGPSAKSTNYTRRD